MKRFLIVLPLLVSSVYAVELNTQMQTYMAKLKATAKSENPKFTNFDYARGEEIFTSKHIGKRGKLVSCTSCHTTNLRQKGENINTGKIMDPLSPLANAKSMSSVKKVKKWLRRNFRDVYNRLGTAQEKGDVITYIINAK